MASKEKWQKGRRKGIKKKKRRAKEKRENAPVLCINPGALNTAYKARTMYSVCVCV